MIYYIITFRYLHTIDNIIFVNGQGAADMKLATYFNEEKAMGEIKTLAFRQFESEDSDIRCLFVIENFFQNALVKIITYELSYLKLLKEASSK
jgi:hypothetical protein